MIAGERADECLNGFASDGIVGRVPLGLDVDPRQAESVLVDDSVDAAVAGELRPTGLSLGTHLDNITLQRLRRNKQLTPDDIAELEDLLIQSGAEHSDIEFAGGQTGGLGLFVRGLVGLDRASATAAFEHYLDSTAFSVEQVRFVGHIVDELTKNGVMEPKRLFESPYTDHAPTGPDFFFPDADVDTIVATLRQIKQTAVPGSVA